MSTFLPICGVYEIRCRTNGRIYVGSSIDVEARWKNHRCKLRVGSHGNIHLQRAWDKHGEEDFEFEVVEECGGEAQYDKEQARFDMYNWEVLFNIAKDAHRGAGRWGRLGRTNSPEHCAKISAALKGRTVWNTGPGKNTWAARAATTRVRRYDHVIVASHSDGRVRRFSHTAEAARALRVGRTSVKNILCGDASRTRSGWTFHKESKRV